MVYELGSGLVQIALSTYLLHDSKMIGVSNQAARNAGWPLWDT